MRTEDGHIISKCLNGDSAAFGLLVDKYKASIYALAYSKLRNFHDAEDVTQDVFLTAYQKLRTLRQWDSFLAWLHAMTLNACKLKMRERSRRPDQEFIEDKDPNTLKVLSIAAYREERLDESLHDALDSLPEMYRQVLTLYYLGGMSGKEIASFLRISPATVRQRLGRARSRLKKEMHAMMSKGFEDRKLQATFTFRIVEAVKRIRVHPMPRTTALPWGLSFAVGIMIAALSLGPHLSISRQVRYPSGSMLPGQAKVLETGEVSVHVLEITNIPSTMSQRADARVGRFGVQSLQSALSMAFQDGAGTWAKKADMPARRFNLSASTVNGKIYAIGGYSADPPVGYTSTVEEYDPTQDKWTKKADMPTRRALLRTCAVNGKICAIGGSNGGDPLPIVEEYDPTTDTWTRKADMLTPRLYFAASAVNGKIYTIGGSDDLLVGEILSTVEEYDPVADKWTEKADMPTPRRRLGASSVGGKIYAIGGENFPAISPTVEEYDPATDTWTRKADMLVGRFDEGEFVISVDGRIYAVGGDNPQIISAVEEYDVSTDTWTKKTDMPEKRCQFGSSEANGRIYVIGGSFVPEGANKSKTSSLVEEYNPGFAGEGKSVETTGKLPTKWGEIKSD